VTESEARDAIRGWIREHNPDVPDGEPADDTPIIERRYLTSLQVADLLLYIEELRRSPVDPARLEPGVFKSIDAISAAFFSP
jgi:hypothetical protein